MMPMQVSLARGSAFLSAVSCSRNSFFFFFAVFQAWTEFNKDGLFDGLDWDLEGNDDLTSPWNVFSVACLNLAGEFSAKLKEVSLQLIWNLIILV